MRDIAKIIIPNLFSNLRRTYQLRRNLSLFANNKLRSTPSPQTSFSRLLSFVVERRSAATMPPKKRKADGEDDESDAPKQAKSAGTEANAIPEDANTLDANTDNKSESGETWNLKISSWNVNGVRAWNKKDGLKYLTLDDPDILCLQETKCNEKSIPEECNIDGYHSYWYEAEQAGYSGTGLMSKVKPLNVTYGIGCEQHDKEGRVITAEYDKFYLVTAYVPNAGRKLVRLEYRGEWDKDLRDYLIDLDKKKPLILCGDLNVAHKEIDLANPKSNRNKTAGFTDQERQGFTDLLEAGFVDSYRHLYPEKTAEYSFWTYMMNARAKNTGWRLDYFVISEKLQPNLCDSVIRTKIYGSDHCPVTLFLAM